jgi:hypothetical protein
VIPFRQEGLRRLEEDARCHQAELRDRRAGLVALAVFTSALVLGMIRILLG